jgi:hypothetical protein
MTAPQTPLLAHDNEGASRGTNASSPPTGNGEPGEVDGGLLAPLTALAAAWDVAAAHQRTVSSHWDTNGQPGLCHVARGRAVQLEACADELRALIAHLEGK